ncbi:SMC-Scp complex subunit ScpB [Sediminibacillus dalangtanensis]|uniref:Segregation and condensation protein B n=1 Tax=Sediminibacillus dalangtanensis TaxID=2729421 RepID=A0ABX7VVS1_9BACI|nr:SMC-Scp complex subunit ScpB [Sediminibacillus dalangtanensis]QTM99705.1 SMC-Scp complex subunit ScpB [Sediminibacillus dalangtanensis]
MELSEFKAVMEGLLFASGDEGISQKQLEQILGLDADAVQHVLDELKYDYEHAERGITIMESNDVLHLTTKPEHTAYYQKLMDTPQTSRLSQAALETLAIIAYQQPITRAEIEEVRGVKSDRPVQTLMSRGLIAEKGRKEGVGRPILYGTSTEFLTYFGLRSLDELPPLPESVEQADVEGEADLFFKNFQDQLEEE